MGKSRVAVVDFESYETSVKEGLDMIDAEKVLKKQEKIVLKPNLTTSQKPPVTTDVRCMKALLNYIGNCNQKAEVLIAEGSGDCDTQEAFQALGYVELAERYGVDLVDLNQDDVVKLKDREALVLKEFYMPKTLKDAFLVSVPVLKEHGDDRVTISMKNLFGTAPGSHYGKPGSWLKTKLHSYGVWQSIVDINRYKPIDMAVVDGALGQFGSHLSEKPPETPLEVVICGFDPVSVDSVGAKLLGHDWQQVKHLKHANTRLGTADLDKIEVLGEVKERKASRKNRIISSLISKGRLFTGIPGVKTLGKAVLSRL